jgi:hypothetical protein
LIQAPRGTFSSLDYHQTKQTIKDFQRTKDFDTETANLSIALMERVRSEITETGNQTNGRFIFDPKLVNPWIDKWRQVATKTKDVIL